MDNKKTLSINLVASFIVTGVNVCVNLFIMPYIVNNTGSEAYGFVSLANNIVNYATIITVALNSVSSRFIALAFHKGHQKEANEYFNSVLWSDIIICIFIFLAGIYITISINDILNVPETLVSQVSRLFLWLVFNFILSIIGTVFTVATYITNKLYLSSLVNAGAVIIKSIVLFFLFGFISINIIYIGVASSIYSLIVLLANIWFTRHLTPQLKITWKAFSWIKTKEMLSSGVWSSITKLSSTLSDGLDTLITNLFLNSAALGALSIAYTIPSLSAAVGSSICALFNPQLTYFYAKEDTDAIVKELKKNMKLMGYFISILFCGIIVFSKEFFSLLVPNENIEFIYTLTCLSSISLMASGIASALLNVFVLTNKLKVNSIVWLTAGGINTIIVLGIIKTTPWGVYAVAGVSKITSVLPYLFYLPIYTSYCLKIKFTTFYPLIIRYMVVLIISMICFYIIRLILLAEYSWSHLIISSTFSACIGFLINSFLLLEKSERDYLKQRLKLRRN